MAGSIETSPAAPAAGAARRRVLVVEDSPTVAMLCTEHLEAAGFEATVAETGRACVELLDGPPPAAMLLDLGLPDMEGIELLREVKRRKLPTSVVVITSNASLKSAIEAMRLGAFDYIVKPFTGERILTTVRNAVQTFALSEEVAAYRRQAVRPAFAGLVGSSPQMQAVYRIIESAAASRATVFITGESGTGKELCAQAIHAQSPRADRPFVALNCAAIPRELMESEIFGHVKGAFTNATADRPGAAMRADGGTLFLDEICEMDLDLQAKILRLTQSGTFERVGGSRTESVDIRIVCATNRDPWAEVQAGRFREDLFYRLHVIPLQLPPLRERGDDVLQLADALLARIDMPMLESLPSTSFRTATIWTEGESEFTGVELDDLLAHLGARGSVIRAVALNDYKVEIPVSDAVDGGPVIAYRQDGAYISRREKGPLWVVYPYDSSSAYRSEVTYSRSIWQLDRLEVTD